MSGDFPFIKKMVTDLGVLKRPKCSSHRGWQPIVKSRIMHVVAVG